MAVQVLALLGLIAATSACEDEFQFLPEMRPDTATVYSLALPQLNLPSAFSLGATAFGPRVFETVEAGTWDIVLDTEDGALVLLLPEDFGLITRTRITTLANNPAFETVVEAPRDTALYVASGPVTLSTSEVYVVRSHEEPGLFGARCTYFTKLQPIRLDAAAGEADFNLATNVNCNDRRLVPEGS